MSTSLIRKCAAGAIIFCLGASAWAQEKTVPIFGLPLGGKFESPIPECPREYAKRKVVCWAVKEGKQRVVSRSGAIWMPDEALPEWAASSEIKIDIDDRGVLTQIQTDPFGQDDFVKTAASISARFGGPSLADQLDNGNPFAIWDLPDVHIAAYKTWDKCCSTIFTSGERQRQFRAAAEERTKKRPLTP